MMQALPLGPVEKGQGVWPLSGDTEQGGTAVVGTWGRPSGVSKNTHPPPRPGACMLLSRARTRVWGWECQCPQARRVPTPCRALAPSCLACPPRPGGQGLGRRLQPLRPHSQAWT